MEVHGFTSGGCIDATFDGVRMMVPDDLSNRYRQAIAEWEAEGNTIPPYEPVESVEAPVSLQEIAGVRLSVDQDNWDVSGVERSIGISGAFLVDVDLVLVFFTEPQPDTNYIIVPGDGVTKYDDYVEVSRPGLTELVFIVQRVQ